MKNKSSFTLITATFAVTVIIAGIIYLILFHNYEKDVIQRQKALISKYETVINNQEKFLTTLQSQKKANALIEIKTENIEKPNYQDFMIKHYETLSDWLNKWLAVFAILLTVVSIILAVCGFVSFAWIEEKKKDIKNIIKEAETVIEQTKQDTENFKNQAMESERKAEANNYFAMAYKEGQQNNYKKAIEYYTKAIDLKKDFVVAYNNRGNAKAALKQYAEGIKDHNKAIEINPNYADAYYNRGLTKECLNRYEEAINDYDKAINLNYNYTNVYNNRGYCKYKLNRYEEAIKDYDKAIEIKQNDDLAYYNKTEAEILSQKFDEALATLNLFIEKADAPYVFKDDYVLWMQELNKHSDNENVKQIKELIETKLVKKDR